MPLNSYNWICEVIDEAFEDWSSWSKREKEELMTTLHIHIGYMEDEFLPKV